MSAYPKQVEFLKFVQTSIHDHLNVVDTLGELLGIGADSTYRRLRVETGLSFEEAQLISSYFGISMDAVGIDALNRVDFDAGHPIETAADYAKYSQRLVARMLQIESGRQQSHMYYLAQDFPLFYIYLFPQITRLKSYYWGRSILALPEFRNVTFGQFSIPKERFEAGLEVVRRYAQLDSSEVWTSRSFLATLKQIQYCWDTGLITELSEALAILKEMDELIEVIRIQSTAGQKINPLTHQPTGAPFHFYITEHSVGNNAVFLDRWETKHTFLSFNTFNFIETTNRAFNRQTENWIQELIRKSTKIEPGATSVRDQYLAKLKRQVDTIRQAIRNQEDTLL